MEQEKINFLLKYAKMGILSEMTKLDPIASEELKQEYINIKQELLNNQSINTPFILPTIKPKESSNKDGAFMNWLHGIGKRQKKYQEEHKDDVLS